MVKVPIWEQSISELPGGDARTPHATPEAFGSQIGEAQISAGKAIGAGLNTLGDALTEQWNEQEALKGKTALSDYETEFIKFQGDLDRNTPPDQASTKPDKIKAWQDENWPKYRQSVNGKYQAQADATAHNYNNRINAAAYGQQAIDKDKYSELIIDSAAEKQSASVSSNPTQLPAATSTIKSMVDETGVNSFEKRRMLLKYGQQLYTATGNGYAERMQREPFNDALALEAEQFRKNGAAEISKQLGVQDLPVTTPGPPAGPVNNKRINQIDKTPAGAIIDKVAAMTGQDPDRMKVKASIESSGNPNAQTGKYKGLFQLSDSEFQAKLPGGDIFNPEHNALAAARLFIDKNASFAKTHGRMPTLTEDYMMHQQGMAGASAHYANPDAPAWQNMYSTGEGRQKGAGWSKLAIWGNVPDNMKSQFGSVENVKSRDLINIYDKKLTGGSGGDITAFKGPVKADHLAEADKGMNLTTQERELYRTHLKNLYGPGGVDNAPDENNKISSRSTLLITTAEIDGKTYLIPTVKDGIIMATDNAIAAAKKEGLENYPSYASEADAKARYAEMHKYIEKDTVDYFEAKHGRTRMVEQPTVPVNKDGQPQMQTQAQSRPLVIQKGRAFAVVPTSAPDGAGGFKVMSDTQAVANYQTTGQHLGVFDNSSAANDYANRLRSQDNRSSVQRDAGADAAAPMLGQTPKEMQAAQDHLETRFKAIDIERKRIQDAAKGRAKSDLEQEEYAVKTHGDAGINQTWTPQALAMVHGPHDAQRMVDERQANLNYHAATGGWTPQSDPVTMEAQLDTLNPNRVDPQSAAFKHYQKNYDEARTLMNKMITDREKITKVRGDLEMKKIIDTSRSGVVTQEAIEAAKPWLTHTELTAAYNLKDNPPVIHNDAATIEVHGNITKMAPPEFQKYIMGWKAKNAFSNDEFKTLIDRNETYWKQGVQPPIVDAHKWLEGKMSPGMAGIEGAIMRGAMADAINELKDWENNSLNQEKLKDRALVMKQAIDIYERYRNQGLKEIKFGLPPSVYFPAGIHPDNVDANTIASAKAALTADIKKTDAFGRRLMSDAEAQTRWQNIKAWQDTLPQVTTPPPAPTSPTAPKKMSAQVAPPTAPPPDNSATGGNDETTIPPDAFMQNRSRTDMQENI